MYLTNLYVYDQSRQKLNKILEHIRWRAIANPHALEEI